MDKEIVCISEKTTKLCEITAEQEKVSLEEQEAAIMLLERVISVVRPALQTLSSRIQSGERGPYPNNIEAGYEKFYFDDQGLSIAGAWQYNASSQFRENIRGDELFLMTDGTLTKISYYAPKYSYCWLAIMDRKTTREVLNDYKLEEIIENLHRALDSHLNEKQENNTKHASERARKLRALRELL